MIDVFDEVSPDLVFLHENQLDGAFNILCKEFDFEYVLVSSKDHPDTDKKPSAVITSQQFETNFKNQKNLMSLLPAAKVTEIHAGQQRKMLESEVLIVTGVVPNTEEVVDSMRSLCQAYRTKIIGDAAIPIPNYLGKVSIFERADFIKSAKVLVDFGSYDYLDASYLKTAPLLRGPALPPLEKVQTFSSITTLMERVDSLLSEHATHSKEYTEAMYEDVVCNHTYYHRCAQVFNALGMAEIADAFLMFLKEELLQ
tara:strand:- start:1850 stop:2614 length:765 start_codon:yes stop_codon:yes gene_type:complete